MEMLRKLVELVTSHVLTSILSGIAVALIGMLWRSWRQFKKTHSANSKYSFFIGPKLPSQKYNRSMWRVLFVCAKYWLRHQKQYRQGKAWAHSHKRDVTIAGLALAFYANAWFVTFWVTILAFYLIAEGISWFLVLKGLPAWQFEHRFLVAACFGTYAGLSVMRLTFRRFLVSLPEFSAGLTLNYFGGRFQKYSQGLHLKWPWEQVKHSLFFSLERVTVNFFAKYVTQDGGVALVEGSYSYSPSEERLEKYAQVDEKSISTAILNIAKSELTAEISNRSAEDARKQTRDIKNTIEALYHGDVKEELELGFDLEDFTLVNVGFDKETQDAMLASFSARTMFKGFEQNAQMREDILVIAKRVTKTINEHRVDGKIKGLDNMGPALGAFTSWLVGRGSKGKGKSNKGSPSAEAKPATT